jgi:hypothetical protein
MPEQSAVSGYRQISCEWLVIRKIFSTDFINDEIAPGMVMRIAAMKCA